MCLHLDRGQGLVRSLVRFQHFGLMYNICEQLVMIIHVRSTRRIIYREKRQFQCLFIFNLPSIERTVRCLIRRIKARMNGERVLCIIRSQKILGVRIDELKNKHYFPNVQPKRPGWFQQPAIIRNQKQTTAYQKQQKGIFNKLKKRAMLRSKGI